MSHCWSCCLCGAGQLRQPALASAFRTWAGWAAQRASALAQLQTVHLHWTHAAQQAALSGWRSQAQRLARKRAVGQRMVQVLT